MAAGDEGGGVEGAPDLGSAAPYDPFSPHMAAIAGMRREPCKIGDGATIEAAEFGQLREKRCGDHRADAWNRTQRGRPTYAHKITFETFPFPENFAPNILESSYADGPLAVRIIEAAKRLNELRENWLIPPDLVKRVLEVVKGYPDRILPVDDKAEKILKKRTLTNLYNERPAWLDNAHKALDEAVAAGYGWGEEFKTGKLTNEEILKRLFDLNQARAKKQ